MSVFVWRCRCCPVSTAANTLGHVAGQLCPWQSVFHWQQVSSLGYAAQSGVVALPPPPVLSNTPMHTGSFQGSLGPSQGHGPYPQGWLPSRVLEGKTLAALSSWWLRRKTVLSSYCLSSFWGSSELRALLPLKISSAQKCQPLK